MKIKLASMLQTFNKCCKFYKIFIIKIVNFHYTGAFTRIIFMQIVNRTIILVQF